MRLIKGHTIALPWVCALGCAGPTAPPSSPETSHVTGIEEFFPLSEGLTLTYQTETHDGVKDMSMVQVHRVHSGLAQMRTGSGVQRLEVTRDSIRKEGGGYFLRMPLQTGASWDGENGGTTVVRSTNMTMTVPAGTFKGCVHTEEEVPEQRARVTVVYCPGVGIARMKVEQDGAWKTFELRADRSDATEKH